MYVLNRSRPYYDMLDRGNTEKTITHTLNRGNTHKSFMCPNQRTQPKIQSHMVNSKKKCGTAKQWKYEQREYPMVRVERGDSKYHTC